MFGIIYIVRNVTDGTCYIGKTTKSLERRWTAHLADVRRNPTCHLHKAMRKYGVGNFTIEILHSCSCDVLSDAEICWIAFARSVGARLYNETKGGEGRAGSKHSNETRAKMSASAKLRKRTPLSEEHKQKISCANSQKIRSVEVRTRIAASLRGRSPGNKGKPGHKPSEEHKKAISDANKKRWQIYRESRVKQENNKVMV